MKNPTRWLIAATILIVLAGIVATAIDRLRSPRLTAALRGQALALELGCFGCHNMGGAGGVPNPGADEKQVPAWDGGTSMMYIEDESEIREWIMDGRPARLADEHADHTHAGAEGEGALHGTLPVEMPAYRDVIDEDELKDLVAYFKAVAAYESPTGLARDGYDVAKKLGCFGCHGPGGRVGVDNPRSFKGYIPPWHGPDYRDLVHDRAELESWILEGGIERFTGSRLARIFLRRQIIKMPAYRDALADGELEALVAYIEWLQTEVREE